LQASLNVFVLLVFMATISSILLILYSIRQRAVEKSYFLIFLSGTTFLYTFGYLLEILSPTLEAAFYGVRMQYMGLPLILPICYLFVRDIHGEKRFKVPKLFLLFIVPVLSILSMQAYPLLRIYYTHIEYISNDYIANCRIYPGPLYHLYTIYSYLLFFLILWLILKHLKGSGRLKRRQSFILLAACLIPVICSIPYVLSAAKLRYDFTPIGNAVSMALLLYAVRYHNLISVVPLARAQVIEAMEDAFIVCDNNLNFLDANRAAKRLFPEMNLLMPGEAMKGAERFQNESELCIQTGGESRIYKLTQTRILQGSKSSGVCIVLHDITEKEKLLEKLHIQASFDPLLGIYNRGAFFRFANLMLGARDAESRSYALLMIDLDFFKQVNDTYGHLAGDTVLKTVSGIVKENFRKDDVIGRYGGEEIVVLLENVSPDRGFDAAEKLREMIENTPVSHQGSTINITVSIGVAYSPSGEVHSLEDMLAQADLALYKAKNNGRNRMWPSQEGENGYA
jgi:diguanylate cyclase (GGDEF)-like protein